MKEELEKLRDQMARIWKAYETLDTVEEIYDAVWEIINE